MKLKERKRREGAQSIRASTRYDMILSFPGGSDAARDSFPGRLHASLAAKGISVCGPEESQVVCSLSQLPDTFIWRSKICIPILSEDYPSSERCLCGLVQMMEGKRSKLQMVLPIFNRVEPSHVRYRRGSFEKARHSDIEGVQRALEEVSMLHGWKVTDGREEELVKTVVQTVMRCLRPDLQKVSQSARYNVFLNFRGTDTRHSFISYIYNGLVDSGVSVFKDDTDLPIGEDFGSQLLSAISRSTIYIRVFSPNYASSKWCLHELDRMMECRESMGHAIIPIFYKVEPSELRNGRKQFQDALLRHEQRLGGMCATREPRKALRDAGELSGWDFCASSSGSEGELITSVVQGILEQLRHRFRLDVPEQALA